MTVETRSDACMFIDTFFKRYPIDVSIEIRQKIMCDLLGFGLDCIHIGNQEVSKDE